MTMFVTEELNAMIRLFKDSLPSQSVQEQLRLEYVNLEATLLRGKVLRDFSKEKVAYIAQAEIVKNDNNLAYLFAPLIIANLNQPVIYTTPISSPVLQILNQYYQAEKSVTLKIEDVIQSLKLYIDLVNHAKTEEDFLFRCLVKALCRTDIFHIFLITHLPIDHQQIRVLEDYFDVKIDVIRADKTESMLNDELINTRKLLFKNKDEWHKKVCTLFAQLNAQLIAQIGQFSPAQAAHLIEDMFYSEHIFEKLSVYAEYMQTRIQNGASFKTLSTM
ncbi:hypothetical protein F957_00162 [Acinetobacter gyllenbergii CIP 110306 = MTCC 11365]|uniref:Uncharacterized protein n=2 Tax=Acinetobacter gyllenbergii TaxID=134534 RepID=A0A829HMZ9_9GAMM|nr:hypothetical protein F957_00162 [Acinetobacter gyllenbergii CIP 110306 = MTCC 11365]ESK46153.1 hypothetical protein F987_01848 [Acinetobacter gyllenbergii NIPH 230]